MNRWQRATTADAVANPPWYRFLLIKMGGDAHFSSPQGDKAPDPQKNRLARL
jgi:hypothetical protein